MPEIQGDAVGGRSLVLGVTVALVVSNRGNTGRGSDDSYHDTIARGGAQCGRDTGRPRDTGGRHAGGGDFIDGGHRIALEGGYPRSGGVGAPGSAGCAGGTHYLVISHGA